MPPQAVQLAMFLLQQLIEHEPEIAAEIKVLFTKADPTDAEWDALHAKVAAKGYRDYVPDTRLPLSLIPAVTSAPAPASQSAIPAVVPITVLPTPAAGPSQPGPSQTPAPAESQPQPAVPAAPKVITLNAPEPVREHSMTAPVPAQPAPAPAPSNPS